jgi:hypothetical protein
MALGKQVTIVTINVQGVFNTLLVNKLLQRIIEQGWPPPLLHLIRSFLSKKRVRVRLEDSTTGCHSVACGTPQGSSLSPAIYMLYLAKLLNQDLTFRFRYADDLCLYRASLSLKKNMRLLAENVRGIIK